MFDLVSFYFQHVTSGDWLDYLLAPHNYHRLVWFRLLLALDVQVFKGTGLPFVVVAVFCLTGGALLLAREAQRTSTAGLGLPAAALALMLILSTANAAGVSVPANTPHIHTFLFAILAILLAEPGAQSDGASLATRRAAAIGCAIAAAFSLAVGLVLWPVLAFMAWRGGKADRRWLGAVLAVGATFTAVYVYGQISGGQGPSLSAQSLAKSVEYFFAYLGLPWVRAWPPGGLAIGVALFLLALIPIARPPRTASRRSDQIATGLILFTLGTATLAAFGRTDITPEVDIPIRYAILTAPLHTGLLLFTLPWLDRQSSQRKRLLQAGVVMGCSVLLVQQVLIGHVAAQAGARTRETIAQFEQGRRTPAMMPTIHPTLARAEAVSREMRERGVYQR